MIEPELDWLEEFLLELTICAEALGGFSVAL
jgi:hypothetical protein